MIGKVINHYVDDVSLYACRRSTFLPLSGYLQSEVGEPDADVNVVVLRDAPQKGDRRFVLVVRHSQVRIHLFQPFAMRRLNL